MKFLKASWLATAVSAVSFIAVESGSGQNWTLTGAPTVLWTAVACSADASRLVAVATNRAIYTSTNSGATWTSNNSPAAMWSAVVSSADGTKLAATANSNAVYVYTSTNAGATWSPSLTNGRYYSTIASSTNGSTLVVAAWDNGNFMLLASADSGASWTLTDEHGTGGPTMTGWAGGAVALSADGSRAVAMMLWGWSPTPDGAFSVVSSNSGLTWSDRTAAGFPFAPLVSSADGVKLVTAASGAGLRSGLIYTSTTSGNSWIPNNVPALHWTSVASSADGTKLVGVSVEGLIYTSVDSGTTWIANSAPALQWTSVASSADGSKLVAASSQGIYILQPPPKLDITLSDFGVVLSWPVSSIGFSLEQNSDLTTANWTPVTNAPAVICGQNQVTLWPTQTNCFYRLKYP